jgi:hypothetical protein
MGTTTNDLMRRTSFRPLLKPAFYTAPVVFGALALKAASLATAEPVLAVSSLAVLMVAYVASAALMIRAMETPSHR